MELSGGITKRHFYAFLVWSRVGHTITKSLKKSQDIIAKGLPASPGAAGGKASLLHGWGHAPLVVHLLFTCSQGSCCAH